MSRSAVAFVAVAAILPYLPTLEFSFLNYDDDTYVLQNPWAPGAGSGDALRRTFDVFFHNYAPLHLLSHAADLKVFGLEPAGHHLQSVLLHSLNAVLVLLIAARLLPGGRGAVFAALLFALHPAQAENVAWVSERKTLLCAFFLLLAALLRLRAERAAPLRRALLHGGAFLAFAAAGWSKALALVFPLLLVALDLFRHGPGVLGRSLLSAIPYSIGAAAFAADAFFAQPSYPGRAAFGEAFAAYLRMIFWPFGLEAFYPLEREPFAPAATAGFFTAAVLAALAPAALRRRPLLAFSLFWFAVTLSPTSGLIPLPMLAAERYLYLPLAGLAWGAGGIWDRGRRIAGPSRRLAFAAILLSTLAAGAAAQARVYRSPESFWGKILSRHDGAGFAHYNLGRHLALKALRPGAPADLALLAQAERHFRVSAALGGNEARDAMANLELLARERGDAKAARFWRERARRQMTNERKRE